MGNKIGTNRIKDAMIVKRPKKFENYDFFDFTVKYYDKILKNILRMWICHCWEMSVL